MIEGYPPEWNAPEQHPVPKKQLTVFCSCRDENMRVTAIPIGDGFSMVGKIVECKTCGRQFVVRRREDDNEDQQNIVPGYFYSEKV